MSPPDEPSPEPASAPAPSFDALCRTPSGTPAGAAPLGASQRRPPGRSPSSKTFSQLFPQLFIFPLLIVTVGVLVYLFFAASAEDSRTVEQILADVEAGGSHARRQDLFALSLKVRDLPLVDGKPSYFDEALTRRLLALYEKTPEAELRAYIVLAMGRAGQPDLVVPTLQEAALAADSTPELRILALQGLGLSRSAAAADVLLELLARFQEPGDWEIRWVALGGLSNIGDPRAIPPLRGALADPRREIRWSAACWLATFFGDASGKEILLELVDWSHLEAERGDGNRTLLPEEQGEYAKQAVAALYRLEGEAAREPLEKLARETSIPGVRDEIYRLKLDGGGPEGVTSSGFSGAAEGTDK